jgi:hypothetical protein
MSARPFWLMARRPFAAAAFVATVSLGGGVAHAEPPLQDYRWFRALSIDLAGRIPTRSEIAAFEAPGFDIDRYIDDKLTGPAYADRVLRIYMDALRLEVGEAFRYVQGPNLLRRHAVDVLMPDATTKRTWVYHRVNQRRTEATRDRGFCFTTEDTGQTYTKGARVPIPEFPTKTVTLATMAERAVKVRPWWLYRDYASPAPKDHYRTWSATEPRFRLAEPEDRKGAAARANDPRLLLDADGTEVNEVWVCKEESQTAPTAQVKIRTETASVSCATETGYTYSTACGCGKGLEWCMPGAGFNGDPQSMVVPTLAPLGPAEPFEIGRQEQSAWFRRLWEDEARHYLGAVFAEDHDFRDVLVGKYSWVNGPLTQFYRGIVSGDCCNDQIGIGGGTAYVKPDPILDPTRLPSMLPTEMDRWVKIEDRGPHAAGLLTLPAFLAKFASRRGRANAVYNAFLCREFVAENLNLQSSTEENLMVRPGCSTCHAKLEPLAAYFSRVKENAFTFIAAPIDNPTCAVNGAGVMTDPSCQRYYDPAFSTGTAGKLRGAYASSEHADRGPLGFGQEVVGSPEFATCATRTVAESMLGRRTTESDAQLLGQLDRSFIESGFRMRALVRELVKTNAYRNANAILAATDTRPSGGDQ